jgi:hypothetical protein
LGSIEERKQKEEKTDDDDGRSGSKDWNGRKGFGFRLCDWLNTRN